MCMEDVRIGRKTVQNFLNITQTVDPQPLLPQESKRIAIVVSNADGIIGWIGPNANIGTNGGILMPTGGTIHKLDLQKHGNVVTSPLFAKGGVGQVWTVWETVLEAE